MAAQACRSMLETHTQMDVARQPHTVDGEEARLDGVEYACVGCLEGGLFVTRLLNARVLWALLLLLSLNVFRIVSVKPARRFAVLGLPRHVLW